MGRNSTSAFEEKHQEASRSTANAERCQGKWNPFGKLIFCVHSDACSGRMLMLQGCAYVCFTLKLCVQRSASYMFPSNNSQPVTSSDPCIPSQQTLVSPFRDNVDIYLFFWASQTTLVPKVSIVWAVRLNMLTNTDFICISFLYAFVIVCWGLTGISFFLWGTKTSLREHVWSWPTRNLRNFVFFLGDILIIWIEFIECGALTWGI